ncbi:hypothetical protein BJX99DRAFT_265366 [Aspergillus californicus]
MSLRQRGLQRAATIAEAPLGSPQGRAQRRGSNFSDSISEARNTIRSSTDELFFPRAATNRDHDFRDEESHWQSAPLGLALLPAIAGIFFQNGSAFVTDVTLLALAAVFLNWSVRLPWEWYHSARTIRHESGPYDPLETPIELEAHVSESAQDRQEFEEGEPKSIPRKDKVHPRISNLAVKELQLHELTALASCFIFPIMGTWILHTIRSKLSRPSEGLVSNYNLTIFLLAAEIRPFSHLLKMVQARTLHLQRIVASDSDFDNKDRIDPNKITDLSNRLEELEAHVAETAATRLTPQGEKENRELNPQETEYTLSIVSKAAAEYEKAFRGDIDALNRAVRRYEKRTAVTAYQSESRFQALEAKTRDALSLAAAAQRSSSERPKGVLTLLFDWAGAAILLPMQIGISLVSLPFMIAQRGVLICRDVVLHATGAVGKPRARDTAEKSATDSSRSKGKAPQTRMGRPSSNQQKRAKRATIIEE